MLHENLLIWQLVAHCHVLGDQHKCILGYSKFLSIAYAVAVFLANLQHVYIHVHVCVYNHETHQIEEVSRDVRAKKCRNKSSRDSN